MNLIIILVIVVVGFIIYRKKKFSHPKTVHHTPEKVKNEKNIVS